MRIFIDESGDLGFDFSRGASSHFTITAIVINDRYTRDLEKAVSRTIKNKINISKKKKKKSISELKGSGTDLAVKQYFWRQVEVIPFSLYSITINKERVYADLQRKSERLYNFLARMLIDQIPLDSANNVLVHIDRSKGKHGRAEFNQYIQSNIESRISPSIPSRIYHMDSKESKGVQAADMFAWGFLRKYRNNDNLWRQLFDSKVKFDDQYLPPINRK